MRSAYHDRLSALSDDLAAMSSTAGDAMRRATDALLGSDLELAEAVIAGDATIDAQRRAIEEQAFALLALQAPVAGDLRSVLAAIHSAGDLERMGDLALHVAKAARRRHPERVLPSEVVPYFTDMGRVAVDLADNARRVVLARDVELAYAMESEDDAMDDLHRHLFTVVLGRDWPHGIPAAIDATLLGRYYERFADHAVAVARRVVFVVVGRMPNPPVP